MTRQFCVISLAVLIVAVWFHICLGQGTYQVRQAHPRLFIEDVRELAKRCEGPLADDYRIVKQRADDAVRRREFADPRGGVR